MGEALPHLPQWKNRHFRLSHSPSLATPLHYGIHSVCVCLVFLGGATALKGYQAPNPLDMFSVYAISVGTPYWQKRKACCHTDGELRLEVSGVNE